MNEDPFDKGGERLRQTLKKRRKELGMSQGELCRKMGRARTFVSKYELGERTLSFPEVLELCRWLQLDEQAFIDRIKGDIPASDAANGMGRGAQSLPLKRSQRRREESKGGGEKLPPWPEGERGGRQPTRFAEQHGKSKRTAKNWGCFKFADGVIPLA